ncbi:pilus assembly protein [Microbulbifer sp. Q7]|uniref:pilus assembly protein n=1 Tax=Microbulbifer sp. Q7 TaxID=1785091 RepID=UPI000835CAF5|nr:PilC/PilY family type IV pilus protein [Microbulbifer sp. Q7]
MALLSVAFAHSVQSLTLAQAPLFLAQPVKPIVMLNMSNDHQLYFKAYDDYTDLDGDGQLDTTYDKGIEYYGYFDSGKCYVYRDAQFEPNGAADENRYCNSVAGSGEWSGNFLNWATMTRMDAVRKILYGGYRSTDDEYDTSDAAKNGETVLERAFLPHDAHSFAKYYNGTDIAQLTPFSVTGGDNSSASGFTICNTTPGTGSSETVSSAPQMRVVQGNYALWASNERFQCRWDSEVSGGQGTNDNDAGKSGIYASSTSPAKDVQLGDGEYDVRVQVCVAGMEEDNCQAYPNGNQKPTGLLQEYGENGDILFGLMTGSFGKNKSGGVLRKNVSSLADEVNATTDGTFTGADGIVKNLDVLRIYGYDYGQGHYNNTDGCEWGRTSFNDGECTNWGNPQSEIYLESLRYLAGKSPTSGFTSNDSNFLPGLTNPTWVDPMNGDNYCAALNVIQFNASTSSYDGDYSDSTFGVVDTWTNKVGAAEGIHGGAYFVGESGAENNQLCTAKTVGALSDVRGTCPDAPRLEGTYDIAGMAYFARANSIRNDLPSQQSVRTYGVALAPAVPQVEIPVPGAVDKSITILPACRNTNPNPDGNCAIVDFKVVSQNQGVDTGAGILANTGKLYVNWEDSEQGGDFDQDMWGVIDYVVTASQVKITTNTIAESTSQPLGFGFVISGTTNDGFHVNSGVEGFKHSGSGCSGEDGCEVDDEAFTQTFAVGTSTAELLETPLYYAAKWGGYSDGENGNAPTEAEIAARDPETYFYAIDPSELAESLSKALDAVAADVGSASSVATNSTRLGTDTVIYQALFNSTDWSGEVKALNLGSDGSVSSVKWQSSDAKFDGPAIRKVFTHDGTGGAVFRWGTTVADGGISDAQKAALIGNDSEIEGRARLLWVRGADTPNLRSRNKLLGDIVNSSPVFAGRKKYSFHLLSEALGGLEYQNYYETRKKNRREVLYVGANDGMLHAFDATTGKELFAYVPAGIYEKLRKLSATDYGTSSNPHTYNVDGPLFVGDAFVNGRWRNVLVGTLGAGGRGLFALDVTNPDGFDEGDVLFDFTDEDLLSGEFTKLGNITREPVIAPTSDGWRVFFGNGYNSDGENAHLFALSLDDPAGDTRVIQAGTGGANGLAGPALLPSGTGEIVAAYAGDLLGNLWEFDLSAGKNDSWGVAYKSGANAAPLFTAVDPNGKVQPITSTPTLGVNAKLNNAVMVYFGTGSYLTSADNEAGDTINSFYAVADMDAPVTGRDQLFAKTISTEANGRRVVDGNADTSWWTSKKGWYLDFTYGGSISGERIISKPLLIYDRLLFPTMITSSSPCSFGGSGWLMELVAVGDRYQGHSIFGEDGIETDYAVISYSEVIRSGEKAYLPTSNIKGALDVTEGDIPSEAAGRMSWRQLR